MRKTILLAALFVVMGGMMNSVQAGTLVSAFTCSQNLPCNQADPTFPSVQTLITQTQGCVRQYIATVAGADQFDGSMGLGFDGCLTTNPAGFPSGGAVPTVTQCCVKSAGNGRCGIQCTIETQ